MLGPPLEIWSWKASRGGAMSVFELDVAAFDDGGRRSVSMRA